MKALWNARLLLLAAAILFVSCGGTPTPTPAPAAPQATPTQDLEVPDVQPPASGGPVVPEGFKISVAYAPLELPTAMVQDSKGHLFVTEFQSGLVKRLTDTNNDGTFDAVTTFAEGFEFPRGLAIEPKSGDLYVVSLGKIHALRDANDDGVADDKRVILDNLYFVDASHANNDITFGPDGRMYMTEGQPRRTQLELRPKTKKVLYKDKPLPEWAGTILSANADGSDVQVIATGFRNPFDLTFDSKGNLYATENGEDVGDGNPEGDELNLIVKGKNYGYPFVLGDPPADSDTQAPLISFPHSTSPDGLAVYEADQFPAAYKGSIFIALFSDPRRVVRAWKDTASGKWQYADFVTNMDRPIAVTVAQDGALYVADMNSGAGRNQPGENPSVIYRVEYVGNK
jgi:glucose/arabinose dehydrogenase